MLLLQGSNWFTKWTKCNITISFIHVCKDTHVFRRCLFFFVVFFPGVILKASYDKLMSICLHGRPAVEMLGGQKRDRTETIT